MDEGTPRLKNAEVEWIRHHIGNMLHVIRQNAEFLQSVNKEGSDQGDASQDIIIAVDKAQESINELGKSVEV